MYNILDTIHSSDDVKKLKTTQLEELCEELREAIIENVSRNGGHLGSNLGVVELTVALHRVYNSSSDRIVFDVGHQCYAHKMLTGRLKDFSTLRQLEGLSGFPKPCESVDDACISGHASASISNALGMARARTILGQDYDVVAVIGDGALTGGLAYEGLADCGESGEPIVVVLNDNGMSIGANVGGMARLLSGLRVRRGYIALKKLYRKTLGRYEPLYKVIHVFKEWLKDIFLPDNMFEDMGFYYLGPIDGHDIKTLARTVRYARELRIPVLVHIRTVKGKGYEPAENSPEKYHGVGSFDPDCGVGREKCRSFSSVFGSSLCELAEKDPRIVAISAAMTSGTGLGGFAEKYPDRFFDVGIAEGHAVSMSAGMAKQGLRPVFAVYSSFLQRGFDMLIHDVSLDGLPAVFAVDRSGLVGADGETHQGVFDTGYLCQVPGMKVYAPASFAEIRSMLAMALEDKGPSAICYPRGGEGKYTADNSYADECTLRYGSYCTIVSSGIMINQALQAADSLAEKGFSAEVIKLNRLDLSAFPVVMESAGRTGRLVIAEENAMNGSVGVRILAGLESAGIPCRCRLLNLGNGIVEHGSVEQLRHKYGIDAQAIACALEEME